MAALATEGQIEPWWDQPHLKQRWRAYNLDQKDRLAYLSAFYTLFVPALASFSEHLNLLPKSPLRQRWSHMLEVLTRLDEQTQQKLAGQSHISTSLVLLSHPHSHPFNQAKTH